MGFLKHSLGMKCFKGSSSCCRLVGGADYGSNGDQCAKSCAEKSLDNFIPKSESGFFEYAELISSKPCAL